MNIRLLESPELVHKLLHTTLLRAANESKYGNTKSIALLIKIVIEPAIGSTIPDSIPIKNAFFRDAPEAWYGNDMAMPSGKFWIAIPIDNAKADMIYNAAIGIISSGVLDKVTGLFKK